MSVIVRVPTALRAFTGGEAEVAVEETAEDARPGVGVVADVTADDAPVPAPVGR